MPGFLGGGGSSSSGTGGEIRFPKEFIDPVTKLRISQPENLIDTDFEYGLQPTKWETVELINNTPSFFSKSGDTTIPGILSISTNTGTREITVVTATDHGLAVGIPINVTGTKSVTADGSYIINSIPNGTTFTYLCKDIQQGNNAIEDLYTSIITGEFFQGSQIRIADAEGIITNGEAISTLTVKTDSTHGFGLKTPFYFLNLNSTISQEFEASNTAAKSFDSSNSATAQTFDGSNTLSTFNIDWSNSATVGGSTSTITEVDTINNTITVSHGAENFANQPLGTPVYYNLTSPASSGYFFNNPRGVVFLKTINALNNPVGTSTFQVSTVPDGDAIDIVSSMTGTFQLSNQARTFAGNNLNANTQTSITVIKDPVFQFDGGNQGYVGGIETNGICTVEGYAGTILVSTTAAAGLDYYVGAMVKYTTTGSAASGLTNNETYFISSFTNAAAPDQYRITIKGLPTDAADLAPTGGSGVQTFTKIGVSITKDIVHVKNSSFSIKDMVLYSYPANGNIVSDEVLNYYFIDTAYDTHNYKLNSAASSFTEATGGAISEIYDAGRTWKVHTYTTVGTSSFVINSAGTDPIEYLVVGGGGGGGAQVGGGGGGGGYREGSLSNLTAASYTVTVGIGGAAAPAVSEPVRGTNGGNSVFATITAAGGGGGGSWQGGRENENSLGAPGGSGGGRGGSNQTPAAGNTPSTSPSQGNSGGTSSWPSPYHGGGGGGANTAGFAANNTYGGNGGSGRASTITGRRVTYAGGGGGCGETNRGSGGGGMGGGGYGGNDTGYVALAGLANTGGGGGGARDFGGSVSVGARAGGSGIVVIRYPITPVVSIVNPMVATGGSISNITVGTGALATPYRVHTFTTTGTSTFSVSSVGNINNGRVEILIVAGGGGTANDVGGGGGGGGLVEATPILSATNYSVVVGGGGTNSSSGSQQGGRGGNSSFGSITAFGGGGGGSYPSAGNGLTGGSGGGAGDDNSSGGAATQISGADYVGYGYSGGNNASAWGSGGGGGAGGPGSNGRPGETCGGGHPRYSDITGSYVAYSGGGFGNSDGGTLRPTGQDLRGVSIGTYGFGANGTGSPNVSPYNGNQGIVIVRYPTGLPAGGA